MILGTVGLLGLTAPVASAAEETYIVDNTGDAAGGACVTVTPADCSLRSAIEKSNASAGESDLISFDFSIFTGVLPGSRIALGSALPALTSQFTLNGSSCLPAGADIGPCVEVVAPSTAASVLTVDNADNSSINGLSLTGGRNGINVIDSSAALTITNNWIGVKLDGSAGGNAEAGIFVDPDSDGAAIGGTSLGQRNVISNNAIGIDVLGADQTTIQGNYIGVKPDGVTTAANTNKGIEITDSTAAGGFTAEETNIGNQISASAAATPACDEGCNVIGGGHRGIDLNGDGAIQEEAPATGPTVIHSNYVGINAGGLAAVTGQMEFGVMLGAADDVIVGGPSAGSTFNVNRIAEAGYGIYSENAENLLVELNTVGRTAGGLPVGGAATVGIFVFSLGVSEPAVILGNGITMANGGVGIEQRFTGSEIVANNIRNAGRGILTRASGGEGSLIEGNGIDFAQEAGILIEDDGNEVIGNTIIASGGAGIRIQTPLDQGLLPSTGNVIGGPSDAENTLSGIEGNAIEISNLEESDNEIGANHGTGNEASFISFVSANPVTDPNGPNHGIKPPAISSAKPTAIGGTALAGARVLVFLKEDASPGDIKSFIGEATADGNGHWSLPVNLGEGTNIAALQTSTSGGSSELAPATIGPPEPEGGGKPGGGGGGGGGGASTTPADVAPPQTKITKGPKAKSKSRQAKFRFSSTEAGSTFQCKLDKKPFRSCRSPKKYKRLKPGRHVFKVRATDAAGNTDPTPAVKRFTVTG
jgi:hypothetical protein